MTLRLLILGGTSEGRELAAALDGEDGLHVVSSLAGAVPRPRLPVGEVRIGGFGGVDGLRRELAGFDVVVDATHPFAQGMTRNAAEACATPLPDGRRIPLLRLARPGWPVEPGWHAVTNHDEAATVAAGLGRRVFITVGRNELARYLSALRGHHVVARMVQAPELELPVGWQILTVRGPFTADDERALMRQHRTEVLVTKNSGGEQTRAKMLVARELGVECVVVDRPPAPPGVPSVPDVEAAAAWVRRTASTKSIADPTT